MNRIFHSNSKGIGSWLRGASLFCAVAAAISAGSARADDLPTKPLLGIETGTHASIIGDLAVDPTETFFATASHDGTVRIWNLASGEPEKVLRVPYDPKRALYSVAISPDGKTIAAAGISGYFADKSTSIYLFDRVSGKIVRRLTGLPDVIEMLRFSPDGKNLAAGLGTGGLRVLRASDGQEMMADKEYTGDCSAVAYRSDGVLAASAFDGFIRIYSADLKLLVRKKAPGGAHPKQVAFSPDGSMLAVGYGDTKAVSVLATNGLNLLYSPATDDLKLSGTAFDCVAWSPDGKQLFAAGRAAMVQGGIGYRIIRRWEAAGKGAATDVPAALETIETLWPLRKGPLLFASADPGWGVLEGNKARALFSPLIDMRSNYTSLLISDDASVVQFSTQQGDKNTVRFDANQRQLAPGIAKDTESALAKGKADGLHAAEVKAPGLDIVGWEDGQHPTVNGHPIELGSNETSRAVAVHPDHKHFLLGCEFGIRMVDSGGKIVAVIPTPAIVWQINLSKDGGRGVALLSDGTVRWFNVENGTLLLTLYLHLNGKQWVTWTPGGFYDAAAGSEDLIGWNINRGKDQTADFYPASRFRSQFYRPDVVERIIKTGSEEEAVKIADAERGHKTEVVDVDKALPPIVTIQTPNNTETSNTTVTVKYSVRTPDDAPVTTVRALVDGRPMAAARRIQETADSPDGIRTLDFTVPSRDCEISLLAENKNGSGTPATIRLRWKGQAAEDITKPKLYVLGVGVSKYKNPEYRLDYAAKDATDFVSTVQQQKGRIYRDVEMKLLTDDHADKESVLDALEWIQKQTTSRDVAMIFLSGHGVRDGSGDYYYVPYNFDNDRKRSTGVLFYEIEKTIKDIAGKVVFFVDTCHSGGAAGKARGVGTDIVSIVNELSSAENGAIVFAASTGKEFALEDEKWGHGAFTKALLEGLGGKADLKGDGRITITSLDYFLSERVKELTNGSQHPTTTKPPSVPDFTIAISK